MSKLVFIIVSCALYALGVFVGIGMVGAFND